VTEREQDPKETKGTEKEKKKKEKSETSTSYLLYGKQIKGGRSHTSKT